MPGTGAFACPCCRMAFGSQPLLRAHEEKLCLGTPVTGSSSLPEGNPPPAEGALGTGRPQDTSVGVSQQGDHAEPRHLLVLPGLPPAVRGQRGPGRVREAPLGDVLTPRERALLRTADPTSRRLTAEQGEPNQQPASPRGHRQQPRELLEAHERHVAEIRARTQQLEQQREGLCRRLAALGGRAAATPHPEQEELELSWGPAVLRDHVGQLSHGGAALTLLPAAGPLTAEARALRQSYLRAGGHHPAILAQLLHLQVEATALETRAAGTHRGRRPEPASAAAPGLDAALLAVELENRRLEDELLALKARGQPNGMRRSWPSSRQRWGCCDAMQSREGRSCPPPSSHPLWPLHSQPPWLHQSFSWSLPGQCWGQAALQPLATPTSLPASLSPPSWPWRTPLRLGSPWHSINLPEALSRGSLTRSDIVQPQGPVKATARFPPLDI
ncbi:coiled-coil domain-containing protein 17 isoform X1 [Grus americana]|uniref:coiled-coil domain-containing protein 17 isoform X1 n=1 Tax=Grus americana TaxID=9117 RepID=UPI0024081EA8|nr:coiled-coil domain-containing protein 17 isoform X1 [Grus americana]